MMDPCVSAPAAVVGHLSPAAWARANAHLVRKAIAEFAHERIIAPEPCPAEPVFRLAADDPAIEYRFRARKRALEHWHIEPGSLQKFVHGRPTDLDAVAFVTEFNERLGIDPETLPVYLEEIVSTLYGAAWRDRHEDLDAAALVWADFQRVEAAMAEGHPGFVANAGRIGFDANDHRAYAPEAAAPVALVWIAVDAAVTEWAAADGADQRALLERELGPATLAAFDTRLAERGLDPADYLYMPVHPWQWYHRIAGAFAADIAGQRIVCLGAGADRYQAQQSIRTLFNRDRPDRCYVKLALSVLNMGFMRGLSPDYMGTTPAINAWLYDLVANDPTLRATGFTILREVAAMGYRQPHWEASTPKGSPYRKMLAALWRESPVPRIEAGQRLMTMAALLHRDRNGDALVCALIRASGLGAENWLRSWLDCYLMPLLHCFYAHDLVFMPHGENLILVLEDGVPVRAFMKDIAEEAAIMNTDAELPAGVQRLAVDVPEELKILSIFTDVFDYFCRYLADILITDGVLGEADFWDQVARCIADYQRAHPEFADGFGRHDLFAPRFRLSCLNRLQLANNRQLVDLADPTRTLRFAGTLDNPIADRRPADLPGAGVTPAAAAT